MPVQMRMKTETRTSNKCKLS